MKNIIELTADQSAALDIAIHAKKTGNSFSTDVNQICTPTVVTHLMDAVVAFMVGGGIMKNDADIMKCIEIEKSLSLTDLLEIRRNVVIKEVEELSAIV